MALPGPIIRRRREAHFLPAGQLFALNPDRETSITATVGTVWVTTEGHYRDHVLRVGDTMVVPAGRKTVAEAMEGDGWLEVVG